VARRFARITVRVEPDARFRIRPVTVWRMTEWCGRSDVLHAPRRSRDRRKHDRNRHPTAIPVRTAEYGTHRLTAE